MKHLLEAMRTFHYVIGITAPKREHEKKVLFLWIGIVLALILIGIGAVLFLLPRVMG